MAMAFKYDKRVITMEEWGQGLTFANLNSNVREVTSYMFWTRSPINL
jgi:hypothetical protein